MGRPYEVTSTPTGHRADFLMSYTLKFRLTILSMICARRNLSNAVNVRRSEWLLDDIVHLESETRTRTHACSSLAEAIAFRTQLRHFMCNWRRKMMLVLRTRRTRRLRRSALTRVNGSWCKPPNIGGSYRNYVNYISLDCARCDDLKPVAREHLLRDCRRSCPRDAHTVT